MPFYMYQLSYSPTAVKAMWATRTAAAAKLVEGLGGKPHHLFFAFGTYDVICLIEAPDDRAMAACAMAVGAAGTVSSASTIKLFTAQEAKEAMAMAGKVTGLYTPPMG